MYGEFVCGYSALRKAVMSERARVVTASAVLRANQNWLYRHRDWGGGRQAAWHVCKLDSRPCEFISGQHSPRPLPGYPRSLIFTLATLKPGQAYPLRFYLWMDYLAIRVEFEISLLHVHCNRQTVAKEADNVYKMPYMHICPVLFISQNEILISHTDFTIYIIITCYFW